MAKSFEQNLKALEKIVEQLESGNASLDEAIGLFQKGKALGKECEERLKEVEMKIRLLTEDDNGRLKITEFDAPPPDEADGAEEETSE